MSANSATGHQEDAVKVVPAQQSSEQVREPLAKKPLLRRKGPNYAQLHSRPLPLETFPFPVLDTSHPLSVIKLLYHYISAVLWPPSSHEQNRYIGRFNVTTRSVHVTDPKHIRALWERGFFGKGTLSRSEPSWGVRERARLQAEQSQHRVHTAEDATRARREERRLFKLERARLERERIEKQQALEAEKGVSFPTEWHTLDRDGQDTAPIPLAHGATAVPTAAVVENFRSEAASSSRLWDQPMRNAIEVDGSDRTGGDRVEIQVVEEEHLQLTLEEAFFLSYGLGALTVIEDHDRDRDNTRGLSFAQQLEIYGRHALFPPVSADQISSMPPDNAFLVNYVVYHHFRSLGWVVRPGTKFSVDYLLYHRGPVFSHAEFAILIVPAYSHVYWHSKQGRSQRRVRQDHDWWWLHCVNRVQNQVRKTLVIVYVEIPPPVGFGDMVANIGRHLQSYTIREFVIRRWIANRSRD